MGGTGGTTTSSFTISIFASIRRRSLLAAIIQPTTEWQTIKTRLGKDEFAVATDLYFVEVSKS
jgi:hypothetical protein